jgi:aminopeptidase
MDIRIQKVAQVLVNYSTKVKQGDLVMIHWYDPITEPLALAVYEEVIKAGANAIFRIGPDEWHAAGEILYKHGGEQQLNTMDPVFNWLMNNIDVRMALRAAQNTRTLSNVDPQKVAAYQRANAPTRQAFMERQGRKELRWVLTQFPTQASAQDAEMSLQEYEDFVYGACMVDQPDPVAYWLQKSDEQQRLVDWLKGKEHIQVKGENIDLSLSIKGRIFENSKGEHNMPDGEIFTGPVEDSVNGWVRFTYPAIKDGNEIQGVEIKFENGKAVSASANKGVDFLNAILDTDSGSRFLGEFAIGTNENIQQFTRNILFDEKIGGTVHMAFGAGYPNTGSVNKSAIHWDMICDMRSGGEIWVDEELFYENGVFKA